VKCIISNQPTFVLCFDCLPLIAASVPFHDVRNTWENCSELEFSANCMAPRYRISLRSRRVRSKLTKMKHCAMGRKTLLIDLEKCENL
jgi:hypothetical protein